MVWTIFFQTGRGSRRIFRGISKFSRNHDGGGGVGRGTKSSPEGLPRQILRIVFLTENGEMCSALIDEGFSISVIFGLKLNSSFPNFR